MEGAKHYGCSFDRARYVLASAPGAGPVLAVFAYTERCANNACGVSPMEKQVSTNAKFIVLIAVLVGIQIGYMFGSRGLDVPVVAQAKASNVVVQPSGELVTCSPDGRTIYVWFPESEKNTYERVKYSNISFTSAGR